MWRRWRWSRRRWWLWCGTWCVCECPKSRSRTVCKCGNFTFSSFFPSSWVSLAFLFLLYFRLYLSFVHAALARSSVSWAAGTVEVSNFDLAHSKPVQKNLMEEKLFHIFSIFLSCCLFEGLEKQSESSLWLLLTFEQNSVCVCVCTQTTYLLAYQEGRSSRVARKKGE